MKLSLPLTTALLLISLFSCKTEEKQGYICNNGVCKIGSNPQYVSYADCQSGCANTGNSIGYNCSGGNCISVTSNAQYSSFYTCQAICSGTSVGYNCTGGNCISVGSNAQYSSLSACQTACVGGNLGSLIITATWTTAHGICDPAYTVVIGLGHTFTEVTNDVYFVQSSLYLYSPITYSYNTLAPGTYYYKAKKTFNTTVCDTSQGIPAVVSKSGSFTITTGQITAINAGSLN